MARSRLAETAVAAVLMGSLAACTSSASSASGQTGGSPATSSATSAAPASSAENAPTTPAATSAATSAPAASLSADQAQAVRATIAAVYMQGVTSSQGVQSSPIDTAELANDFAGADVLKKLWGSAGSRPLLCGTAKYNGVAIGSLQLSGDTVTAPMRLYFNTTRGPGKAITVSLDAATGKIKSVACGGTSSDASFPGIVPIVGYYGAMAKADAAVLNTKPLPFFTAEFNAWEPVGGDSDKHSCSQYVPDRWAVALSDASDAASNWDFAVETVKTVANPSESPYLGFPHTLGVDLVAEKIARVSCGSALVPKIPDPATPADVIPDAIGGYLVNVLTYYAKAADQKSLGVDAKSMIQPYFTDDTAFAAAWSGTGATPLLCAPKMPGEVTLSDGYPASVSGPTATVAMVTWPSWHPDSPGQELSKFTVTLDVKTMKISSITCTT